MLLTAHGCYYCIGSKHCDFANSTYEVMWHGLGAYGCCLELMDTFIGSILTKWFCEFHFESMMSWAWTQNGYVKVC